MTSQERFAYSISLVGRCLSSMLDLVGVIAIGYLATSIALFVARGSDASRKFQILGWAFPAANVSNLPMTLGLIIAVFVLKAALSVWLTKTMALRLALVQARASKNIAESILGKQLPEARSTSQEDLIFAVTIGASSAFTGILSNLAVLISEGFMFLGLAATFLVVDPISTFIVLCYFSLMAWAIQYFVGGRLAFTSESLARNSIQTQTLLNDLSAGFRELAVMGRRAAYFEKVEKLGKSSARQIGNQIYLVGMPRYIVETGVLMGVLAFGGLKLLSGNLEEGVTTLGVFFTGSMRIMAAMLPWQAALIDIRRNIPQASRALQYLAQSHHGPSPETISKNYRQEPVTVKVTGLGFRYSDSSKPALKDISLTIEAGTQVAFIGASGSGKSTLADLIVGLQTPSQGNVLVGGTNPEILLQQNSCTIAYVPQKPGTFAGTIEENITLDTQPHEPSRMKAALESAHLTSLITSLNDGLRTNLGTNRDALSGGQLQRVGLARALYASPSLLVLDEATSALDAESEDIISKAIASLRGKVTSIVIAHRLNTVQHADRVFLFHEGQLIDQGSFSELVQRNPYVAEAVNLMAFDALKGESTSENIAD